MGLANLATSVFGLCVSRGFIRVARAVPALLPVLLLLCLLPQPVWGAVVSQATVDGLRSAAASGSSGDIIVSVPGIDFGNTAPGVSINRPDTTMQGGIPSLDLGAFPKVQDLKKMSADELKAQIDAITAPVGMTYIDGNSGTRGSSTMPTSATGTLNSYKLLRFTKDSPNTNPLYTVSGSGFGLKNMNFKDFKVAYNYNGASASGGGVVNSFIGGDHDIQNASVSMDDISGNAFTKISVDMQGVNSTHYLAGGGILGLRSTGSFATMSGISGNLFKDLAVVTHNAGNNTNSPYIEGGGIIGLDAVSSPDFKQGSAVLTDLSSNLFTGINVDAGRFIIGGGVVGLNNNSKTETADPWVMLGSASGNIFGNGTLDVDKASGIVLNSNITVTTGTSLRGGGVIGLNGLSNVGVALNSLTDNFFGGIYVKAGEYIRGGGIVGLQTNDELNPDAVKKDNPDPLENQGAHIGNAENNLFFNIRVDSGTRATNAENGGNIEGGGILGLRSNNGIAYLGSLLGNTFQELDITTTATTPDGSNLIGGGVVGLSSAKGAALVSAKNNWFDGISVDVAGRLGGGGLIGLSAGDNPDNTETAAILSEMTDNYFGVNKSINVLAHKNISGGGIVGVHTADGSAVAFEIRDNRFNALNVEAGVSIQGDNSSISGGGVFGLNTEVGGASVYSVYSNSFSALGVTAAGNITGGGVFGLNSNGGSYIGNFTGNNTFSALNVSATSGNISGGGVIGLNAGDGAAWMDNVSGSKFSAFEVNSGNISGGGVFGLNATGGRSYIDSFTGSTFDGSNIVLNVSAGGDITGGGILGLNSNQSSFINTFSGNSSLSGNSFNNLSVASTNGSISGGGIIGLNATGEKGSAYIGNFTGSNTFNALNVSAASGIITGGGIIGLNATGEGGRAYITNFTGNNTFNALNVSATSGNITGGGVIGLNATGANGSAYITSFTGTNTFDGSKVIVGGAITGGGILGLNATDGSAYIGSFTGNNRFNAPDVDVSTTSGNISGGGVIGLNAGNGDAWVGNVSGSNFSAFKVNSGTDISGGGVFGLNATDGDAYIINFTGTNTFDGSNVGLNVRAGGDITGGGILGLNSNKGSSIDTLSGSSFMNIGVESTDGSITGGGVIGLNATGANESAYIRNFTGNNNFNALNVSATSATSGNISGGGIVGLNAGEGAAWMDNVSGSKFIAFKVNSGATGDISGGGVFGLNATGGSAYITGNFIDNTFDGSNIGLNVVAGGDITGGGILGLNSDTSSFITTLSRNSFKNLRAASPLLSGISAGGNISGGGVIGLASEVWIDLQTADNNTFDGIKVNADGYLRGGGVFGLYAWDQGGAPAINALTNNKFDNLSVGIGGDISGGGVFGLRSDSGLAGVARISGNTFNALEVSTTTGDISGGGVIGLDAVSGSSSIGNFISNTFGGQTVTVGGSISGGGITGLNATGEGGRAYITNFTGNNTFNALNVSATS
ncbi:MAG: hypothetical protein LBM00_08150, partial [Deltaproteobacteria bacterium]|nr:hypothetical protein [Deltaproteobacteria bacterium]